ncbi:GntR family transcriptional regulator [Chitinimonas sp.]|uniref:GntR family transcriptional regulator n=1 Tax=Chitinimonas sp. TaxID=1934313 RepID=UPI002F94F983
MPPSSLTLFSVSPGSPEPLYRQLMDQIRRLVAGGQLAPGDDLPSVRDLAQSLTLNPMTVSKAYGLLEMEGVLQRRRGLGMQVAGAQGKPALDVAARLELLRPILERAALEARQLELDSNFVLELFQQIFEEKT